MSRSLPPLTWFRSFEAAARTLSFTAAAEEIGLTQSAVSQQVKSLELRLGVPLFLRKPRGLALTDDGRKLLPQVGAALETLTAAAGALELGRSGDILTVATSVSVAQWLISPNLQGFTAQHPALGVRLQSAVWPDEFRTRRADVEIRFGSTAQVGKDARRLEPGALVPVKAATMAGNLHDLPLIETVGTSDGWRAWTAAHGDMGQPTVFADTYGMALHLAAHGNGVALVSELLVGPAMASGDLVRAHPGAIPGQEGYYLSADQDVPAASAFETWLLDLLAA